MIEREQIPEELPVLVHSQAAINFAGKIFLNMHPLLFTSILSMDSVRLAESLPRTSETLRILFAALQMQRSVQHLQ